MPGREYAEDRGEQACSPALDDRLPEIAVQCIGKWSIGLRVPGVLADTGEMLSEGALRYEDAEGVVQEHRGREVLIIENDEGLIRLVVPED